jgi:hypothetical protein
MFLKYPIHVSDDAKLRPLSGIAENFRQVARLYDNNCWYQDVDDEYRKLLSGYIELGVHIYQRHEIVKRTRADAEQREGDED